MKNNKVRLDTNTVEDQTKLPKTYKKGGAIYVESEKAFFSFQSGIWIPMFYEEERIKQYNRDNFIKIIFDESDKDNL